MSVAFYRRALLKKLTWLPFSAPLASALLSGCSQSETIPYRAQILVFGTQVDLLIFHPNQTQIDQAIAQINQDFQKFHHEWHAWEYGGILSKINAAIAEQHPIVVADSVKAFIEKSQQLSQQSDYLFDPGIGKLIALWGFHGENWQGPPPDQHQIEQWLANRPSIADIEFTSNQLRSRNPQVQLDFGGNAKGLALDMALVSLQNSGIKTALVSIGGDMKSLGLKPNHSSWQIAVENPSNIQGRPIAEIPLEADESLVTSGTYQRYFEWQGKRYSHLLNPNTGYPAQGFASVTVIHPDATTADSAATALLIAGPKLWQKIAKQMSINFVLAIDHNGQILQTKAMASRSKLL